MHLVEPAEDVGVVLGERAHAEQPVQDARELMAVDVAELGQPQGQLAVAAAPAPEHQARAGAVHRLDREPLLVDLGEVHVLVVVVPVAAALPQLLAEDHGRADLLVPEPVELRAHGGLDLVDDDHALGQVEREAGTGVVEVEQLELAAESAMVAGLGELDPRQVGVELGLGRERGGVEPGQHRVRALPAPVGAGDRQQLERADATGVVQVGSLAQVDEVVLLVQRHGGLAAAARKSTWSTL